MIRQTLAAWLIFTLSMYSSAEQPEKTIFHVPDTDHRVTSIYLSQEFLNTEIKSHFKSDLFQDLHVELNPANGKILFHGIYKISEEQLQAINLETSLRTFRFQITIKPEATRRGYLVLEFPLNESFFYPVNSKHPEQDRIIIPVQLLSLALASARGYLAALSGDFTLFDRQKSSIIISLQKINRSIAAEKNPDKRERLENERDSIRLKLAAIPIDRKRMQFLAKDLGSMMSFLGEKELNLNEDLAARHKALIVKLNLAQMTPYLTGMELGGIRILHDNNDGPHGENYFSVDINANIQGKVVVPPHSLVKRPGLKVPPSAIIRINQALFESPSILSMESKLAQSKIKDIKFELRDDSLQASGKYQWFLFSIPFSTNISVTYSDIDQFLVGVAGIKVAGFNLDLLSGYIMEILESRLSSALKGILKFKNIGKQKNHSQAMLVTVNTKKLIPALTNFHIIDVRLRDHEILLKAERSDLIPMTEINRTSSSHLDGHSLQVRTLQDSKLLPKSP